MGLGAIAGPALLGAYAELHGLRAAFLLTAGAAALALLCAPGTADADTGAASRQPKHRTYSNR
ncbi:hypothetical protein ACFTTN_23075 [Streptomyces niveus]|uniref:hypothetical protein n=1 Tax=Streptomyces niveus TaxID=193462 RepID=UPI003640C748